MTDTSDLPHALRIAIEHVTAQRYDAGKREFKRQRMAVIRKLRLLDYNDAEIARLLGVTKQYLGRVFPRKGSKP